MPRLTRKMIQFQAAALEAMPLALLFADLGAQKILYMNRALTQLTGDQHGDFDTVWDWIAAFYPDASDPQVSTEQWIRCLEFPGMGATSLPKKKMRMRCKDGSIKTVLRKMTLLPHVGFSLVTFVDLAAAQNKEPGSTQLSEREREQLLLCSMLLDYSREMIVISPHDRSKRVVSSGVLRITGFSLQEYLEQDSAALNHPKDLSLYLEVFKK